MVQLAVAIIVFWILIAASVRAVKIRLLLFVIPIVVLCALVAWYVLKTLLIPAELAEVAVPGLDATVQLAFYYVLDGDSGRYLYLRNAAGRVRKNMSAFDWVHWPRTSLYLMGDGRIAVLGPTYDDYVLDPKRLTIETLWQGTPSDTWTYFGAFDFNHNKLQFIPASEQRECTETRGVEDPGGTRPQGRAARCYQRDLKNQS
jgi:hypothetical protein